MEDKFVIYLPEWAPTVNTAYATVRNRRVLTSSQREFRKLVNRIVKAQMPEDWKYAETQIILIPPDKRVFDVDNRTKPTLDALTNSGFWRDDSQVSRVDTFATTPNKDGGCIIVVKRRDGKYYDMREVAPLLEGAIVIG